MDALSALHNRISISRLDYPAPTTEQMDALFKAGLRACDHRSLKPWKFLVIEGAARNKFGELLADVKATMDSKPLDSILADKIKAKPLRAPTIIVVVAKVVAHDKVPEMEQVLSAGAAAQMMMVAAHAQGLGAIWRSGSMMFHADTRKGLGLADTDQIVGFLYVGTPIVNKSVPNLNTQDFVEYWQG